MPALRHRIADVARHLPAAAAGMICLVSAAGCYQKVVRDTSPESNRTTISESDVTSVRVPILDDFIDEVKGEDTRPNRPGSERFRR